MINGVIAGPWTGEFGWELFCWQGVIRRLVKDSNFDDVVIISRPGHEVLYEDFSNKFIEHGGGIKETDMLFAKDAEEIDPESEINEYLCDPDYKWINPRPFSYQLLKGQQFVQYGNDRSDIEYDIVIHARDTNKINTSYRNWSRGNWLRVIEYLLKHEYRIACIGSKHAAMGFEGVADYRGLPLKVVCDVLRNSGTIVGPSSGPMHLATLCKTPQVVWTDDKYQNSINGTNRKRYEMLWNPFDVKTVVLDHCNWQPEPVEVIRAIEQLHS